MCYTIYKVIHGKHYLFRMNTMTYDFHPLTLSEEEISVLRKLHALSRETGYEYLTVYDGNFSEPFTSRKRNEVSVPKTAKGKQVKLYHSHTNNTSFSSKDLKLLLNEDIISISVITNDGKIFHAYRGSVGILPTTDDYIEFVSSIEYDVTEYLCELDERVTWTEEDVLCVSILERNLRISRYYEWTIEGGTL